MDVPQATALMEEVTSRAHAAASLVLATGNVTLTGTEPEVLELGITTGATVAMEVLLERGLLRRDAAALDLDV